MAEPEVLQREGASYAGEFVQQPVQRWTTEEKLVLLDWHPLFSGRCPNCEIPIALKRSQAGWKCDRCGWQDDSV